MLYSNTRKSSTKLAIGVLDLILNFGYNVSQKNQTDLFKQNFMTKIEDK